MLVNGTQILQSAGWTPGGVHLPPDGRAMRECRPRHGRNGQFCLLALDHPYYLREVDICSCIVGDYCTLAHPIKDYDKKGCKLAKASIHEHDQGGPQPGRPIYIIQTDS